MNVLCKFRSINEKLIDSIEKNYIYFSHPDDLNDPFDCKIDISKSLNIAINKSRGRIKEKLIKLREEETYIKDLNVKLSSMGIFSSSYNMNSKSLRESLLWSHYGNKHKGLCLIYNIPDDYVLSNSMGGVPVIYKNNSLTNHFIKWANSKKNLTTYEFIDELAKKYLSIKDKCWKYENEYRLIRNDTGEFIIDKSFLKYICFGLNAELEDEEKIIELTDKHDYEVELIVTLE